MECFTQIENHELVTDAFGGWPSFDDFEVISLTLERGAEPCPALNLLFLGLQPPLGAERKGVSCLLTLRFLGIDNLKLEGFNHQNAVNGLSISEGWSELLNRKIFRVEIVKGFGVGASFDCDKITVMTVQPR